MNFKNKIKYLIFLSIVSIISCKSSRVHKVLKNVTSKEGKTINTLKGDCIVKYDAYDRLSGKRITELKPEEIFSFTHDKLKPYFTDRPFLTCYAGLSRKSSEFFLLLKFIVDTKYIKTGYNGISNNSMLRITLIGGDKIYLKNIFNNLGTRDVEGKNITYNGIYPISKSDLKTLKKVEIDKMGVEWNGGVEEYEVYNIDFLIKQLECLNKINDN